MLFKTILNDVPSNFVFSLSTMIMYTLIFSRYFNEFITFLPLSSSLCEKKLFDKKFLLIKLTILLYSLLFILSISLLLPAQLNSYEY
jgi:hypothetical protein